MSNSLQPHGLQHTAFPCPSQSPWVCSNSCPLSCMMPSNHLILCWLFSSRLQFSPTSGSFPVSQFFPSDGQSIGASASVLPMNIQDWFPLQWLVWSLCSPRDFEEYSPGPQFESISSLTLSLLYGPTLTSIHDYWKNHSFDYMELCWQSNVSAF